MNVLKKLLILDDDGAVNLINIALWLVLIKLAIAPTVGVGEICTLLGVLVSHLGHRVIDSREAAAAVPVQTVAIDPRVDELLKKVGTVQSVESLKAAFAGVK